MPESAENTIVSPVSPIDVSGIISEVPYLPSTGSGLLWLIFGIILLVFAVYSLILLYHWIRFGFSALPIWIGMVLYFGVSFILISTLLTSAIAFSV